MNRRCLTRTAGAAAGGLLGAAFLPVAVAFADDFSIAPVVGSGETVTGLYGLDTAPPAVNASLQGFQTFDVGGNASQTFTGDESAATDIFGNTNEEVLVTATSGTVGTAPGDVPPVGSVFDYYSFGDSGYANVYSDLASATPGGDVISDTLVTPFGNIAIATNFDAASGLATALGKIDPTATPTAVNGLPPLDVAVQYQLTGLNATPLGAVDGTFDGDQTTTVDAFGFSTNELLVTSSGSSDAPLGSLFNTITLGNGWENDYSAIPSVGGGDVITDTLTTPFGTVGIPVPFDAAAVANAASIPLPGGESLVPVGTEVFTGVNGVPPLDVATQGTQTFDIGTGVTLNADVSTSSDAFGDIDEAVRVLSSTGADAPGMGSVFDIYTLGDSGLATVFSDVVSGTTSTFADTFVTPFGDFTIPLTDAIAGFGVDSFLPIPF